MPKQIRFDPSAAFASGTGLEIGQLHSLAANLEKCRDEICDLDVKMRQGSIATPASKQPFLSGFYLLPEEQLASYVADRQASPLARILAFTKQMMANVDRVVILGPQATTLGCKSLLQACCQPFFNELNRADRGSRPRISFAGGDMDNDQLQGILHLLDAHRNRAAASVQESWGLVVLSKNFREPELLCSLPHLRKALKVSCQANVELIAARTLVVSSGSPPDGTLAVPAPNSGAFPFPADVAECFSVLSPAGLAPAALMGINVMKLLEGAAAINEHFRTHRASENMVLQFAAANFLSQRQAIAGRMMLVWNQALAAAASWYSNLVSSCLIGLPNCPIARSLVAPRDLSSQTRTVRGHNRELIHNVFVESSRFDNLAAPNHSNSLECPPESTETFSSMRHAELERITASLRRARRPSTLVTMPLVDEYCMGQYFQLLMLATVVEARLHGINPYNIA